MKPRGLRLEWISLLYLLFFVLAVISPSLIQQGLFGFSQTQLEEFMIFLFGLAGIMTFSIYERAMEHREHERKQVEDEFARAQAELIESYTYIGSINRKIDLLKKVADNATVNLVSGTRMPKELFHSLAANARAAIGAESALIRFIDLEHLRTDREFSHHPEQSVSFRASNRELRDLKDRGLSHSLIADADGSHTLVVPSDGEGAIKGYLLLRLAAEGPSEVDASLLKVFINQAEVLYGHFTGTSAGAGGSKRLPILGEVR